jgi:hypothetical protein
VGYEKPQLSDYGTVQELTATGGTEATDVPFGTPNTGPGTVTGDIS